jgi:hypothetical protein
MILGRIMGEGPVWVRGRVILPPIVLPGSSLGLARGRWASGHKRLIDKGLVGTVAEAGREAVEGEQGDCNFFGVYSILYLTYFATRL